MKTFPFNLMTEIERIDQLREELHAHNHNYYILNAPTISDQEFDHLMRELQDLEAKHPEHYDPNSPSVRGSLNSSSASSRVMVSMLLSDGICAKRGFSSSSALPI